jgi:hypothetical protein
MGLSHPFIDLPLGHRSIGPSLDEALAEGFIGSLVGFVLGIHFPRYMQQLRNSPK